MTQYVVQPREIKLAKGYKFVSFTKYMGKIINKNINKNLSDKYSQKLVDYVKQPATDTVKISSKRVIKKEQKWLVIWLIITLLRKLQMFQEIYKKNPKTVTNEHYKKIPKERYMSPKERQQIIDELRII